MSAGALLLATGTATLLPVGMLWVATGCQTHQCDATSVTEGVIASPSAAGVGSATVSPDGAEIVWYSSPVYGQWLALEGNQSLEFTFPLTLPDPYACQPWPAPVSPPNGWIEQVDTGAITPASGQPFVLTSVQGSDGGTPGGFVVSNESCQPYYVLVEALFPLPTTPCPDALTDGGADDAATE
ncbi:MAG: hypothetical protein ABTD50_06345 [Polyangiaceae bacterium]